LVKCVRSRNTFFVNEVKVAVPFVAHNLQYRLTTLKLTLPQVKHLTGMIILI
jgi:hypothetical protein